MDLAEYRLTKLWEDGEFVLSRGTHASVEPVLLVTATSAQLTPASMARLERAHSLRDQLDAAWASRPQALVEHRGRLTLVSSDPAVDLLARHVGRPWSLPTFLRVAIGASGALRQLHARGIVHKDIKPANLLADRMSGNVWITGFGIASRLPRERQLPEPPEVIAGSLAYMAPEQTGRMNRSIDSRSDLYALGITYYELLTGTLPFAAEDPMEWVHCHIARQPLPLQGAARGIPPALCAIVSKLLAKAAEDRYQTAKGVELDLRYALQEWEASGAIKSFVPGGTDVSDRLIIPEKLYGRAGDIAVLLASLERVVDHGRPEIVLVSGYSGIGKSSLVNELHHVLVPPRGLYASGKYDQYKRNIPYGTLAQAFHQLIKHVLGKPDTELRAWSSKLTAALGRNGRLIANLVPELELVIGPQPEVPELPANSATVRFQTVVRKFIGVFAQPEHPLALFLDDLQWLDLATLQLLEVLVADPELRHLLLVGAYRDNEVDDAHPLVATLAALRRSDRVHEIVLAPLEVSDVAALCADALHADLALVQPLADLVHAKTLGNPFFSIQFITELVDESLLELDVATGTWRWDVAAMRAKGFTDNVVELMARKLDRLHTVTRCALRQLACVGNTASLARLQVIYGISEAAMHDALAEAVRADLVLRTTRGYSFVHDRVQEAAYAMIPDGDRAREHLRIGSLLAGRTPPEELEDNIFEIVNHLSRGASLIAEVERERIAELGCVAGRRAMKSSAHAAALMYITFSRSLLGPDVWERNYRLAFDLELLLAECEFLTADLDGAEARLDALTLRAASLVDRAAVIYLQTTLYTAMPGRSDRAIEICLGYLHHVGIEWSPHPAPATLEGEHAALIARIGGRSIEELVNLPLSTDADHAATLDVLLGMMTPAFNTDPPLVALILCRMGNLSLASGTTNASSLGYAFLGMVLGSMFGDFRTGYLFGKLALDLVEVRGITHYRGRVYHTLGTHVTPWTQPLRVAEGWLRRGLQCAYESGDVTYGGFSYCGLVTNLLAGGGTPLDQVQAEAEDGLALVGTVKFAMGADILLGHLRLIRAMRGELAKPTAVADDGRQFTGGLTTGWYWLRTMQACFILADYPAALEALRRTEPLIASSQGFVEIADFHFTAALIRAVSADAAEPDARADLIAAVTRHRAEIAVWVEHCADNFAYRLSLVDAELARLTGRHLEAMDHYEQAIRLTRDQGLLHHEAIACELAARFYSRRGFATSAHAYLANARSTYLRWGAVGKVYQLDGVDRPDTQVRRKPASSIEAPSSELDLASVMKSSEAVSTELDLAKLVETLMVIALEHAGASRGVLVLPRAGELHIEAEAITRDTGGISVVMSRSLARHPVLPETVLHYVSRAHDTVLVADALVEHQFSADPYFGARSARSVLCVPLVKQGELVGLLYLENNLMPDVFTHPRIAVLRILASQAATSLQNASLEKENATLGEKESLLKEVHHRVKNNLQLISSLLNLQASRITDPAVAELFAESRNRVRAMALVHENLYRAGNFAKIAMATHLGTLCNHLSHAYGLRSRNVVLVTRLSDVHLEMTRAVNCGLIINELLSNALKHAFPDNRGGQVRVELSADSTGTTTLVVGDNGVGLPSDIEVAQSDSLGLQLVHDLSEQLHGTMVVTRGEGTTFTLTFGSAPARMSRR